MNGNITSMQDQIRESLISILCDPQVLREMTNTLVHREDFKQSIIQIVRESPYSTEKK